MKSNKLILVLILIALAGGVYTYYVKPAHHEQGPVRQPQKYYCPMHPHYVTDKPGDCPICHMRLVPMDDKMTVENGHEPKTAEKPGAIRLDSAARNQIGAKIETVIERPLRKTLSLQAKVAYEPELYDAELEYLQKIKRYQKTSTIIDPVSTAAADRARTELVSMGIPPEIIREMNTWKTPDARLIGADPNGELWANLYIYGEDLEDVSAGAEVEIQNPVEGKPSIHTTIQYLDHHVHSSTGNVRAWALVKNTDGHLRPEMFLQAKMVVDLPALLSVPENAVLYSGEKPYVFVQTGDGVFEPRMIGLGRKAEGYYEVLSGLKSGDVVIASGNFLVDSESRIRSAIDNAPGAEHSHG